MHEAVRHALLEIAVPLPIAAIFAIAGRLMLRKSRDRTASVCFALAVIVPMPVAFFLANGSPTESWERLIWLTASGGAIGLACLFLRPALLRDIIAAVALAAALTAILWRTVEPEPDWAVRLAPGLAAAGYFLILRALAARVRPLTLLLALWASAAATGLGVITMGQMSMGAAVAPVGASLLVLAIFARGDRTEPIGPAVLAPVASALAVTPAIAWMWAKTSGTGYGLWLPLLIPLSILAVAIVSIKPLASRRPILGNSIATLAVLLTGLAIVAAMFLISDSVNDDDFGDIPDFMQYPMD